jgi:hypothetical protein
MPKNDSHELECFPDEIEKPDGLFPITMSQRMKYLWMLLIIVVVFYWDGTFLYRYYEQEKALEAKLKLAHREAMKPVIELEEGQPLPKINSGGVGVSVPETASNITIGNCTFYDGFVSNADIKIKRFRIHKAHFEKGVWVKEWKEWLPDKEGDDAKEQKSIRIYL